MRVRLYELGASIREVFFIEEFPADLRLTEMGQIQVGEGNERSCFLLEEREGLVLLHARQDAALTVNDAPLEDGPLMPGDHLRIGDRRFLVSYESTMRFRTPPARFRIQHG